MYRVTPHEEDGKVILAYHGDVEPLLEKNHRERRANAEEGRFAKKRDFRKVMSVDFVTIMRICKETGLDFMQPEDAKQILKILKRPEYKYFRTVPDKHI